jgi:hypothetical protein
MANASFWSRTAAIYVLFSFEHGFPFPLGQAKLIGDFFNNRQRDGSVVPFE